MVFTSILYVVFFVIVVSIYFSLPRKLKWIFLLLSSLLFYISFGIDYLWLLFTVIIINYFSAIIIFSVKKNLTKTITLILSLFFTFSFLLYYKYFVFLTDITITTFFLFGILLNIPFIKIALPLGISFFTFKAASYTIDVYKNRIVPEKNMGMFGLFITMFPQLLAGPIDRANYLLPQLHENTTFDYNRVMYGLSRIFWGLFKKVVIADRLALYVNEVYSSPGHYTSLTLILAVYLFSFQIYLDFSGYTDIAVGSARVLGFKIMENFKYPYFATSIPDFWRRWHISLSTWFRDYIYIPLGGNRVSQHRRIFNIFLTFFLIGLWHGANYTFVFWGVLNSLYYFVSLMKRGLAEKTEEILGKKNNFLYFFRVFVTFHLVCFGWIFFRAENINKAFGIITSIFTKDVFSTINIDAGLGTFNLLLSIGLVFSFVIAEGLLITERNKERISKLPFIVKTVAFIAFLLFFFIFGIFEQTDFIYFRF